MNEAQQAALVTAQAAAALIEMEAMKAANIIRLDQGKTIAYDEGAFMKLIETYGIGYNSVMAEFR